MPAVACLGRAASACASATPHPGRGWLCSPPGRWRCFVFHTRRRIRLRCILVKVLPSRACVHPTVSVGRLRLPPVPRWPRCCLADRASSPAPSARFPRVLPGKTPSLPDPVLTVKPPGSPPQPRSSQRPGGSPDHSDDSIPVPRAGWLSYPIPRPPSRIAPCPWAATEPAGDPSPPLPARASSARRPPVYPQLAPLCKADP